MHDRRNVAPSLSDALWPDGDLPERPQEGEVGLWRFVIVAPPHHPDPVIRFNLVLSDRVGDILREPAPDHDKRVWGLLMEEVVDMAERKVEDCAA